MFCRYVYKGPDRAIAQVAAEGPEAQVVDEVSTFHAGRYYSPCEAIWRYNQYPLYQQSHHVERLPVHLSNQQNVTFSDISDFWETLQKPQTSRLLQWFKLNKDDVAARQLLYHDLLAHYTWDKERKRWQRPKKVANKAGLHWLGQPKEVER